MAQTLPVVHNNVVLPQKKAVPSSSKTIVGLAVDSKTKARVVGSRIDSIGNQQQAPRVANCRVVAPNGPSGETEAIVILHAKSSWDPLVVVLVVDMKTS